MIDRKQRDRVIKLFEDGVKVSNIAKEVRISRQSVYNIIQDNLKTDPEIIRLKKELEKTRLKKQIDDLKRPQKREDELADIKMVIDRLISKVQMLWGLCDITQNLQAFEYPQYCVYCGEEIEDYVEEDSEGGVNESGYKCKRCKKVFPFPFPFPFR